MSLFDDLIGKIPALMQDKEKFDILENRLRSLEQDNSKLATENKTLRDRLAVLDTQQNAAAPVFTEAAGVLWKRKKDGGHEITPYCPQCKTALADYSGSLLCLKCNIQAPIKSYEAPKIHHDLFDAK